MVKIFGKKEGYEVQPHNEKYESTNSFKFDLNIR
jgi:hypothetical protein